MPPNVVATPETCWICHQPTKPEWYFCPNCGNKLHPEPLKTDALTQLWIYAFSIVIPMLCFLFITKWPGFTYLRSKDEDARTVGTVALALIIISTIVTVWLGYVWVEQEIQTTNADISTDLTGY